MTDTSVIPSLPDYSERVVTFIDILGFKHDTRLIEQRSGLSLSIDAILRKIGNCRRDWEIKRATAGIAFDARLTHFSDCLVMSYQPIPGAFRRALADAAFIGHMVLAHGYLPRGIIAAGKLYHDDAIIYGAGLIDAYEFERDNVVQPRIAIHGDIIGRVNSEIAARGQPGEFDRCVHDRSSGPFVHIAGNYWPFVGQLLALDPAALHDLFNEQRHALLLRYASANEKVRQKIEWMSAYLNDTIDEIGLPGELKSSLTS